MSLLNLNPSIFKDVKANVTFTSRDGKVNEIFPSQIVIRNQINHVPTLDLQMAPISISAESPGGDGKFGIDDIKSGLLSSIGLSKETSAFVTTDTFLEEGDFFQNELLDGPGNVAHGPEISVRVSLGDEGGFGWRSVVSDPVGSVFGAAESLINGSTAGPKGDGEMLFMATQPVIHISKNSASVRLSGLHPIARLNNIVYHNYEVLTQPVAIKNSVHTQAQGQIQQDAQNKGLVTIQEGAALTPATATLNHMMDSVFQSIKAVEGRTEKANLHSTVNSEEVISQIQNNKLYEPVLNEFLLINTTPEFDNSLLFGNDFIVPRTRKKVLSNLGRWLTSSENVLDVIMRQVTTNYLMQFRCSLFARNPIIERSEVYQSNLDLADAGLDIFPEDDTIVREVDYDSITMSLAPKYQLPINQVTLFNELPAPILARLWNISIDPKSDVAKLPPVRVTVVSYPKNELKRGKPLFVRVPKWMDFSSKGINTLITDRNTQRNTVPRLRNTMAGIFAQRDLIVREGLEETTEGNNFLLQWARAVYENVSLRYTSAVVVLPLDLTMEVGKIYTMKTKGSGGLLGATEPKFLFQGYLEEVEHHLSINNDSGQTYTRATFAYVRRKYVDQESDLLTQLTGFINNPIGFISDKITDIVF